MTDESWLKKAKSLIKIGMHEKAIQQVYVGIDDWLSLGRFAECDGILTIISPSEFPTNSGDILLKFLELFYPYRHQLVSWESFRDAALIRLLEIHPELWARARKFTNE